MTQLVLQKSAEDASDDLPKEVLNPLKAAQQYDVQMHQPSAELSDFVEHYWVLRWDMRGKPPFVCEVIPSPNINMTFMHEGARITGVTTGKYTYEINDVGVIFGIQFRPGGFHPFWRQSVHLLTDKLIPASSVFGEINESFNTAILSLKTDADMLTRVEQLLLDQQPAADKNIQIIANIIEWVTNNDAPTVRSAARQFGMSERSVQELFQTYVGVGLKWVILRSRLQKAAELAVKLKAPNWTSIANDLGYSDQAHFVNAFKKIIGRPPAEYAAMSRTTNLTV